MDVFFSFIAKCSGCTSGFYLELGSTKNFTELTLRGIEKIHEHKFKYFPHT